MIQLFDENGTPVGTFTTIQAAVDAASDNYSILLDGQTYREQVVIEGVNGLTITGDGVSSTVEAPDDLIFTHDDVADGGSRDRAAVFTIRDAEDITIEDLTVDGRGVGDALPASSTSEDFEGILFFNASGTVDNSTVTGIRDELQADGSPKGNQRGNAIVVLNEDGTARTVDITDNVIEDFQKTGIVLFGEGLSVTVSGNDVEGSGFLSSPTAIAQNGIQISDGAGGVISGNIISEIGTQRADFFTTGVLAIEAGDGLQVVDNSFFGATDDSGAAQPTTHTGVYIFGETDFPVIVDNDFVELTFGIFAEANIDGPVLSGNAFTDMFASVTANDDDNTIFDGTNAELYGDENDTALSISMTEGSDIVVGTDFADTINGLAGDDEIDGGDGRDDLDGGDGDDVVAGGAKGDQILGGDGADILFGEGGNDTLRGGAGDDALFGGDQNDLLFGGEGADFFDGGRGFDYVSYTSATGSISVDLLTPGGNTGEAAGDVITLVENLVGSNFDDTIGGGNVANELLGRAGNDTLDGRGGADLLDGGGGVDILTGGQGFDTYRYSNVSDSFGNNRDTITDFEDNFDVIDVSRMDANSTVAGNQAFTFIDGAQFSGNGAELRFENGVVRGDANADGVADFAVELTGITSLEAGDFIL